MDPWTRQPYDTDESWPVFQEYRDQNPPRRRVIASFKGRPIDPIKVARWSRDHYWKERVALYDAHLDALRLEEREALLKESVQDVSARHMRALATAMGVVDREMGKLLATVEDSAMGTLKPRDLIKLMETVIRYDRLVRGETTDNVGTEVDLSHLTDQELAEIEAKLRGNP